MANTHPPITDSLAPTEISLETLTYLLSLYPETAKAAYRDRALEKARPKLTKKAKKRAIADGTIDEIYSHQRKSDKVIDKEVDAFLKLNEWRYETMPQIMRERAAQKPAEGDEKKEKESDDEEDRDEEEEKRVRKKAKSVKVSGMYLEKEDLLNLVDWKLKHGTFRPTLLGMAKSNQGKVVRKHSCAGFARLPVLSRTASSDDLYPAASLDHLSSSLRGTGPATASLILSLAPEHEIPFFSDELYFWLCMDVYPGAPIDEEKEKKIDRNKYGYIRLKYNMREYRQLWDAVQALKERIKELRQEENEDSDSDSEEEEEEDYFSSTDIEKIAFVIGHLDKVGGWEGTAPVVERTAEEKELIEKRERNRLAYKDKMKREKEERRKKRAVKAAKQKAREEKKKKEGGAGSADTENKKKRKRT